MAPHEAQAQSNYSQSLERLAQRGGLSPVEAMCAIKGVDIFGVQFQHDPEALLMAKVARYVHGTKSSSESPLETETPEGKKG